MDRPLSQLPTSRPWPWFKPRNMISRVMNSEYDSSQINKKLSYRSLTDRAPAAHTNEQWAHSQITPSDMSQFDRAHDCLWFHFHMTDWQTDGQTSRHRIARALLCIVPRGKIAIFFTNKYLHLPRKWRKIGSYKLNCSGEAARCFVSLHILLSHSKSSK